MKKISKYITVDMILVFVLGFSLGLYLKNIAQDHFTIGHGDPNIKTVEEMYDIDALEQGLISQGIPPTAPDGLQNTELLDVQEELAK